MSEAVNTVIDYDMLSAAGEKLTEIENYKDTINSKLDDLIDSLEEMNKTHDSCLSSGIDTIENIKKGSLSAAFTKVSTLNSGIASSVEGFKDSENMSEEDWSTFISENELLTSSEKIALAGATFTIFNNKEDFKKNMTEDEINILNSTMAKITGEAYSAVQTDDTPSGNTPGNTSGTGGYSLYSGTGAITTATAFSTVNQARVEDSTSSSNEKPSETPIEDNKEEPSTGNDTNNDNNTEKPNDGDNNTEDNNTGDNNKPSEGGNNNQVVPPTNNNGNNGNNTNNSNNNASTSRPGTPVGGNNNTGSSYRPSGNNNHYATSNNDQITPPTSEDGTNISETTPSAPESDTNISSSAGEELDVISIDRGNNKTSSASASSNDGGNVVPTILGVGVAAGAAVAGAKYIKDKKEKDNTYEDNIGEEDAFSYLGDYEGDLSDENAPRTTKYKAGNVNKLVLDDSDGEVKIEDNYQEPTEQKEELE